MSNTASYEQFLTARVQGNSTALRHLKTGVWLYFLLIIFEGALRKWFLPFLSTPLLIIRDPIAIWVIITALNKKILQPNNYITAIFVLSLISFVTAVTVGHGNVAVALFGLRILLVHFPFMFAIGAIFTAEDVIKIGKATLWIAIPMVILNGLQFYSPQTDWVNKGVGDDEGAGFRGALGYFRPPGTFSFTNGNALFFGFVASFVFYFLLHSNRINRLLLTGASIALIASIPLSISRSLSFTVAICGFFMLMTLSRKPQYAGRVIIGLIGVLILFIIVSRLAFFQTASEAFISRFTSANESEGGLVEGVIADRYFGGMIGAITNSYRTPFFGYGLGMGTNVGAQLLSSKATFLISEGEWGRLIGEMGLLIGLLVIFLRIFFCFDISVRAYQQLSKNNALPWMMLSFALLSVPQGQWAQPTSLGFSVLAGGLVLASLKQTKDNFIFASKNKES